MLGLKVANRGRRSHLDDAADRGRPVGSKGVAEMDFAAGFDSRMSLIAASDFSSEEAEWPTPTLRTMDPLTPVRPVSRPSSAAVGSARNPRRQRPLP